jgi:alanyl-tRNA synthetase
MVTSFDIRAQFLDYFKDKGHTVVPSSVLVPQNDPTLLFTNAGMVQFKSVFLGDEQRPYSRAASSQKCMRAGGKHNDLENVGRTARHHTFFEMLGNFSFGDYFKAEAIALAWEFMTQALHIPTAGLWVTVYEQDDEAYGIWKKTPGVSSERIVRMGERDNFWSMGDTGPCGPCSEILIDQGPQHGCGRPGCAVGCDCDRFLELWNLVFMQYNRDLQGRLTPLPRPSIDTGMGLERVTAVKQGVGSNYDTDLFRPLIGFVEQLSGRRYRQDPGQDTSMRIIADHSRAVAFLVADGVLPANEGRGYVLRRIMRRAARHGRLLGLDAPFLHTAVRVVAEQMQAVYPEVLRSLDYVSKVALNEEQAFAATLEAGLGLLEAEMARVQAGGGTQLPGEVAFRLYDTYGFPMDLTVDIAAEKKLTVDQAGFDQAMQAQKTRARQAWKGSGDGQIEEAYKKINQEGLRVAFSGYERAEAAARIQKIICSGQDVPAAAEGDIVEVIAAATPFYGESGGQVGDTGTIAGQQFSIAVSETLKPLPELIVHKGRVVRGQVRAGDEAVFRVDLERRQATANNHTATHILHAVLRAHLGSHVKQAGSLVSPERLRFDFTHFEALTADDVQTIEGLVNQRIRQNTALAVRILPQKEALAMGATALFGEKYGDQVRVVNIGDYSMELCGGTHTRTTGELGFFKIVSEGAVAAGVRRIEAVTGAQAFQLMQHQAETIARLAAMLKAEPEGIIERVERVLASQKTLEREIEKLKSQLISRQAASILDEVREIGGVKVLAAKIEGQDPKELRTYGDKIRDRLGSGIIVFGAAADGKAQLLCMVTKDHCGRFSAGRIIQQIAPIVGGRGGGRDDMAQAGGKDVDRIDEALALALDVITEMSATT